MSEIANKLERWADRSLPAADTSAIDLHAEAVRELRRLTRDEIIPAQVIPRPLEEMRVLVRPQDVAGEVRDLLMNVAEDVSIFEVPDKLNYRVDFPMFLAQDGFWHYGESAVEKLKEHQRPLA